MDVASFLSSLARQREENVDNSRVVPSKSEGAAGERCVVHLVMSGDGVSQCTSGLMRKGHMYAASMGSAAAYQF